jgi:peptidoglycan/LPS O-acetylase OafA/YrhL
MSAVSIRTNCESTATQGHVQTLRLHFLDGMRGVAAFMVIVHHYPAFVQTPEWILAMGLGNPWVSIFITLSGFCLYLPVAGQQAIRLPYPFKEFMTRRAWRILPAWYAALLLSMGTGLLLGVANYETPFRWLPLDIFDLLTHITLTHSMTLYSGSILGPGYTLGTEWQLYILMLPFLMLARRFGWIALVAVVALLALPYPGIVGKLVHKIVSPTFAGPFVLGLLAVRIAHYHWIGTAKLGATWPQGLTLATLVLSILAFFPLNRWNHDAASWSAGLATATACILLSVSPKSAAARVLGSRVGRTLGSFSYSLYLTHFPLLALCGLIATTLAVDPNSAFAIVFVPGTIVILLFAYWFHLLFERPFLNTSSRTRWQGRLRTSLNKITRSR